MVAGEGSLPKRLRKKPDFFNVSEVAQQGLSSKPAKQQQGGTPEPEAQDVPASVAAEASVPPEAQPAEVAPPAVKRAPGRPRKSETAPSLAKHCKQVAEAQPKRPRGRPRKQPTPAAAQPVAQPAAQPGTQQPDSDALPAAATSVKVPAGLAVTAQQTTPNGKAADATGAATPASKKRGRTAQLIPLQGKKAAVTPGIQVTPVKPAAKAASPQAAALLLRKPSAATVHTFPSVPAASGQPSRSIPITVAFSAHQPTPSLQQQPLLPPSHTPAAPLAPTAADTSAPAATTSPAATHAVSSLPGVAPLPAPCSEAPAAAQPAPLSAASEPSIPSPSGVLASGLQPGPGQQALPQPASSSPVKQPVQMSQQSPPAAEPTLNGSWREAPGAVQTVAAAMAADPPAAQPPAASGDPAAEGQVAAVAEPSAVRQSPAPSVPLQSADSLISPPSEPLQHPILQDARPALPAPALSPAQQQATTSPSPRQHGPTPASPPSEALAISPGKQQAAAQPPLTTQSPAPETHPSHAESPHQLGSKAPLLDPLPAQQPPTPPAASSEPQPTDPPAGTASPAATQHPHPSPATLTAPQLASPARQAAMPVPSAMSSPQAAAAPSPATAQPSTAAADPVSLPSPAGTPVSQSSPAAVQPSLDPVSLPSPAGPPASVASPAEQPAAVQPPALPVNGLADLLAAPTASLASSPAPASAPSDSAPAPPADAQAAEQASAADIKLSPAAAKPSARTSAASAVLAKAFRIKEPRVSALALPATLLSPSAAAKAAAQPAASAEEEAELLLKRTQDEEEKRKLCEQLDAQMRALKRTRPSIAACTAIAVAAAHKGGAGQVVRQIMDAMQGTKDSTRRVDLLYLLDSLVQTSQKQNAERSGPSDPMVARLYRDTVSAALRRVVNCICQDLAGCEKALKVLNIWADRDLLFKPSLEDGKAVAVKRQEALLAAKAEEAARQAAAAQALKRAAEAKLNPRSKAPRLAALENEYGNSTGAGRISLEFGLQRKQVADDASDDEDDEDEDDEEEVIEELHQPASGGSKLKAHSQSTSQGGLPPGLTSSPLDQMGPNFGDDFDEIYSSGLEHQDAPAFAGQDERPALQQQHRQASSGAIQALSRAASLHIAGKLQADRAASSSTGLLHSHSGAATLPLPPSGAAAQLRSTSSTKAGTPRSLPPPPAAPWLTQQPAHSSAGRASADWHSGGLPHTHTQPAPAAAIEGGLSYGPSWDPHSAHSRQQPAHTSHMAGRAPYYHSHLQPAGLQAQQGAGYPGGPGAWAGYAGTPPAHSQQAGYGFGHLHGAPQPGLLPPLPPEDDASDPAPPLPYQDVAPPLPPEDDAADPPPLPPGSMGPYMYHTGHYPQGMMY